MSLDYGLVKQFANITNDSTPEKTDPDILIGTIQANGDVLLDGATSPTPAGTSTANYKTGDRVTCIIENHECKVIGNATAPSVQRAEDLADGSIPDEKLEDGVPRNKSIYRPPTDEDPGTEGEVWFDVSNGNAMYIYTNGVWQPKILSSGAIIAPDGSKVYYQADQPTDGKEGDTWFKKLTDSSGRVSYEQYEYSNGSWNKAAIDGSSIKTGSVTADQISSNYVYAGAISADQITGGKISGCTFETTAYSATNESGIYTALAYYYDQDTFQYWDEAKVTPRQLWIGKYIKGGYPDTVLTQASVLANKIEIKNGYGYIDIFPDGIVGKYQGNLYTVLKDTDIGSTIAAKNHTHSEYAASNHDHSGVYAAYSHAHYNDTLYCTTLGSTNYKCRVILDPASISSSHFTDCGYSSSTYALGYNNSSRRYKHDIQDVDPALFNIESLYDLPVRQFKYNEGVFSDDENYDYNTVELGFIAEEVSEKFPFGCYYKDDVPEAWTSKNFTPALLYLIQEQKKQIDSLEERLTKLEAKLEQALSD